MEYFNNEQFWFFYHGAGDFEADDISATGLEENFDKKGNLLPPTWNLPVSEKYNLRITIATDAFAIEVFLVESASGKAFALGWWDEARWHPYFLRWEELQRLLTKWSQHPDLPPGEALLCMLARFTGNEETDPGFENHIGEIRDAYTRLGLSAETVEQLIPHSIFTQPAYKWVKNPKYGDCFTGEYACYSVRNEEHAGGKEAFPFAQWNEMMKTL